MSQSVKPKVDVDATRARLQELGLNHASEMLNQLLTQAVKEEVAPHVFLDRMLAIEYRQREERRVRTSLRLSGLPTGMTLGNFDFAFQPGIEKSRIETLATCSWVREHETVLLQGPPGIGKTHLAVALGVRAVENGFSVAFYRFDDLLHAMKKDADIPPRRLRGKKYMKVALLAVDEV
jgi:DNA replication protein DnaC